MSLKTYPGSDLNLVSKKIQDYLNERKLKTGDIVKYRLLNGTRNIDPTRKKEDSIIFPSSVKIKLKHSIYDPGDEGENNGKVVDIGVVRDFDNVTKLPTFLGFSIRPQKGDGGIFMIRASVVSEMEMYETLELSNDNASNPFRDTSVEPLFERVNEAEEGKARSTKRNYLFESLAAIRSWDYNKMRIMAAGYNISTQLPMDVLRDRLEEIAEKSSETFYKSIDSDELENQAIIKIAKDAGVISYVPTEHKWIFTESDELITLLDRKENVTENQQFALFLKNSPNGEKVKAQIQRITAAKNKPKKTV